MQGLIKVLKEHLFEKRSLLLLVRNAEEKMNNKYAVYLVLESVHC